MKKEKTPVMVSIEEIREKDSELINHAFFKNKDEIAMDDLIKFLAHIGSLRNEDDETRKAYNKYKKTILSKEKRDKHLFADATYITKHIVKYVLQDCIKENSQASFLILLSLFTGRELKIIERDISVNIKTLDDENSQIYFIYNFNLKEYDLPPEVKSLIKPTLNRIALNLPDEIFKTFKGTGLVNYSLKEVEELKETIKSSHNIRVSLKQISEYMTYWMVNNGFDTTEIAIINGKSIKMVSGVHYYQVPVERINRLYQQYVNHLLGILGFKKFLTEPLQKGYLGSNLVLKKDAVSDIFRSLKNRIYNIKIKNTSDREEQYNLIVLYTLLVLNLSTGQRPVKKPYQTLKQFNFDLKTVHISDKARDNELPYRVCMLTELAINQLNKFIEFLEYFGKKNQFLISGIKQNIKEIILGEQELFRFLKKGKFIKETSKHIKKTMEDILPIKLTWHRHFIRSNLPSFGLSGQQIDMWMGHEGKGGTGFSKYSSMSMEDLGCVADAIDELFKELQIEPLELNND